MSDVHIVDRVGGIRTILNNGVYEDGEHKRVNSCFAIAIRDALIQAGKDQNLVNVVFQGIVCKLDEYFGKDMIVDTDRLTIEKATSWNNIITQILNIFDIKTCLVHRVLPSGKIRMSEYGIRGNKDTDNIIEIWTSGLHFEAVAR